MSEQAPSRRSVGRPKNPVSRQFLLDKARASFAQEGFAGASMGQIAKSAGLQKSSLFHHFPSKESLYQEVFALIVSDLGELAIKAQSVSAEATFVERLDSLTEGFTRYLATDRHASKLLMREFVDEGPFFSNGGRKGAHAVLQAASGFLAAGMQSGDIPEQDPHHLVMSLTGLHMMWFAVSPIAADLAEAEVFDEVQIEARVNSVKDQVRRLCGATPANASTTSPSTTDSSEG